LIFTGGIAELREESAVKRSSRATRPIHARFLRINTSNINKNKIPGRLICAERYEIILIRVCIHFHPARAIRYFAQAAIKSFIDYGPPINQQRMIQ